MPSDKCPRCHKSYSYILPDYDTKEDVYRHENVWQDYSCRWPRAANPRDLSTVFTMVAADRRVGDELLTPEALHSMKEMAVGKPLTMDGRDVGKIISFSEKGLTTQITDQDLADNLKRGYTKASVGFVVDMQEWRSKAMEGLDEE